MNVPASKQHSNDPNGLVGVPKKSSPPLWWRFFFWPGALAGHKVPEHVRSAGMYCPECRKGQPFSDRCAFCGCNFTCFVVINAAMASQNKRDSDGAVLHGRAKLGAFHVPPVPHHTTLARTTTVSLRVRVLALCVALLLLVSLGAGIVQYRSNVRRQYAHNYVQALYVLKSGMNLGEMVCNGTFNAWRGVEASAVPEAGGIGPQALADLEAVKTAANKLMGELGTPSAEYNQAAHILQKLYALYEKTNSMVVNSPVYRSRGNSEMAAAREEFSREIGNLKANLPAPLADELKKAGKKYDLRFMGSGR